MRFAILTALASIGCEKDLLAGLADAGHDAPPDAPLVGCPTPAQPGVAGMYKVYLNTEGVVLRKGNCDDARTNCTNLVVSDQMVVPPFLDGNPDRQMIIDQIATAVQGVLAPYSVDVVTARPATGDYEMIVIGGNAETVSACTGGCLAQSVFGCNLVANRDHVDLVFDVGEAPTPNSYINQVLQDFGLLVGVIASTQTNDCMCREPPCGTDWNGQVCTFGTTVPTTMRTLNGQPINCGVTPTEDEPALLKAGLGCR